MNPQLSGPPFPRASQVRGPSWVRLHRRPDVHPVRRKGLPFVPIAHCLIDVATTIDQLALEALFDGDRNAGELAGRCSPLRTFNRTPRRRRCSRATAHVLSSHPLGTGKMVARALSARNFPLEINVGVGRYYGDLVCRRARVIVEIDGREFHTNPATFDNDRKRQNERVDDDWRILRYSAATAIANLDEVVDDIIRVVRKRRRSRRA